MFFSYGAYARLFGVAVAILIAANSSLEAAGPNAEPGATVDELLAMVKKFNPDLAAAALDSEAAVARIAPAGALDDPTLNVLRDEGFRQTMVTVSQKFPLWGKRDLREGIATADAAAAKDRESDVSKRLDERLKAVFARYYEADQAVRVTKDIRALLHALAETTRARYAQGLVNQSDAIRAELEESRLDSELASLDQAGATARAKINALIAHPAGSALAQPTGLRAVPSADSLPLDRLVAKARDANPVLAATKAEINAAEGERKLVDKSWYPDVTVTLGGDDMPDQSPRLVAGVGIEVPLQWGVRDARAHAANATKAATQMRLDGELLDIQSEIESALATLRRAERTGDLLKNTLGPQSEAAYRSALSSYQLGRGDLTSVLDAARKRFDIQLELLQVGTDAQTALAAIERLVGGEL